MKKLKKFVSMMLTLALCLGMSAAAFAADADYTITVENSIGGATYSSYKVFDANYNEETGAVSYTIDSTNPWYNAVNEAKDIFTLTETAAGGTYQVTKADGTVTDASIISFLNTTYDSLKDTLSGDDIAATGTGNGGNLKLEVGEPGYYFVTTSTGAVVSVTTAVPEATVIDKNQKPGEGGKDPTDPDTEEWEGGFTKEEDGTSFSIGDEIEYLIRSYVPTYDGEKQVTSYTITDTMSAGLTLEAVLEEILDEQTQQPTGVYTVTGGVKVELVGTGITDSNGDPATEDITKECTITVTYDNEGSTVLTIYWEIEHILDDNLIYPADAVVRISYTDEVNDKADDVDMKNVVAMRWMMIDPDVPEGEPEEGKKEDEPEVIVYTYGFDLKKTDGSDEPNILKGAQFTLQKQGSTGLISFLYDEDSDTYEEYDSITMDEYGQPLQTTTDITVSDGEVNIWGLGAGTYILTETVAPDGYNLLSSPVTIVITEADNGWTVTVNGSESTGAFTAATTETDSHGVAVMPTVTVVNNAGAVLPSTGGMGTTIFYVVGICLMIGAGVVLIVRRRMRAHD